MKQTFPVVNNNSVMMTRPHVETAGIGAQSESLTSVKPSQSLSIPSSQVVPGISFDGANPIHHGECPSLPECVRIL